MLKTVRVRVRVRFIIEEGGGGFRLDVIYKIFSKTLFASGISDEFCYDSVNIFFIHFRVLYKRNRSIKRASKRERGRFNGEIKYSLLYNINDKSS